LIGLQRGIKILRGCWMKEAIRFLCNLLTGSLHITTNSGAAGQGIPSNIIRIFFKKALLLH